MLLWTIHPRYLDQKGLCGLWREALYGQNILIRWLEGANRLPYLNSPYLKPFRDEPGAIREYLMWILREGHLRGYRFNQVLIEPIYPLVETIPLAPGRLVTEKQMLRGKLSRRAPDWWRVEWNDESFEPNPVFQEGV